MRTRGSLRSGPSHSSLPLLLILIRLKPSHHRDRIGPSISAVRRRLFSEGEGGRRRVRSCGYVSLALSQVNLNLISFIVVRVRTPLPPHPIRDERNSDSRVPFLLCGPLCAPEGRSEKLTFLREISVRSFVRRRRCPCPYTVCSALVSRYAEYYRSSESGVMCTYASAGRRTPLAPSRSFAAGAGGLLAFAIL